MHLPSPIAATLVVVAYLLGSVCFGLVYARRVGVNLREIGSGNVGATNVKRAFGRRAAWTVMALDLLKGGVAVGLARALGLDGPELVLVGCAAVLGHVFPIYFGFRGGKGAATSAGALLATAPLAGVIAILTFAGLKALSHRASVGSLGGAGAGAVAAYAIHGPSHQLALAATLLAIVTACHIENIRRLLRGEEPPA